MNSKIKAIIFGFVFSVLYSMLGFSARCEDISQKVLRLHIIANSDSAEDQSLKLKVRDEIISEFGEKFKNLKDVSKARGIAQEEAEKINAVATNKIRSLGYNYEVKTEITKTYFPIRTYREVTLPAGCYEAIRISIGQAKGKNWWCVMFPPMCLPAAEEKHDLGDVLNSAEMDIAENESKYVFKLKFLEIFCEIKNFLEDFVSESLQFCSDAFTESDYEMGFKFQEFLEDLGFLE